MPYATKAQRKAYADKFQQGLLDIIQYDGEGNPSVLIEKGWFHVETISILTSLLIPAGNSAAAQLGQTKNPLPLVKAKNEPTVREQLSDLLKELGRK